MLQNRLLPIIALLIALASCAKQERRPSCTTNFAGTSLSMRVSVISGTTYKFELCEDAKYLAPGFTVYGAQNAGQITDPSILQRYRLSHVIGVSRSGDSFQVTFSSDSHFVIYADNQSGNSLEYAMSTEMVRGDLSQAAFAFAPQNSINGFLLVGDSRR
jgi:hypothetical protein